MAFKSYVRLFGSVSSWWQCFLCFRSNELSSSVCWLFMRNTSVSVRFISRARKQFIVLFKRRLGVVLKFATVYGLFSGGGTPYLSLKLICNFQTSLFKASRNNLMIPHLVLKYAILNHHADKLTPALIKQTPLCPRKGKTCPKSLLIVTLNGLKAE